MKVWGPLFKNFGRENCKSYEALNAYKFKLEQQLKPNDQEQRRDSGEWITEHLEMDADFLISS